MSVFIHMSVFGYFLCFPRLFSGVVYSGLCAGVSAGKVHEEGLFWTAKSCRNGGKVSFFYVL